jgi:hypothetical protein
MAKQVNFFDGAQSSTVPTVGNIDATSLVQYANDAAYEAANAGSPIEGNIYANTTDNTVHYYDGTSWTSLVNTTGTTTLENKTIDGTDATGNNTVSIDATDAAYNNATSGLTATDAQGAIDEVEGRLDTAESSLSTAQTDVSNLETLSGVAGATDNGTFTGTTIADSSTTKSALQDLETEVETKIASSEKGATNGVATLDGSGKVPSSQLTVNAFEYLGTWDANTNTPTLADGVGNTGDTYRVSVAGSQDLGSGSITFAIDDKVVYNPSGVWENWSGAGGGDLWSDPVNSNIVPDTDNTYTIGDLSNKFAVVHSRNFESRGTTASASGLMSLNNTSGDSLVRIQAGNTTPTGVASSGAMFDGFNLVGDLAVHSNNNNDVNSTATKSVAIETGNKTAGTGNSGDIKMTVGTSSGGTQGDFKFLKSGTVNSIGDVWTATSTDGKGYWAAGAVSGANDTLSNLASPTAINQDLEFAGTNTVRIPNNVSYEGVIGGGARTIARVDTSGRIQMGQAGVDFRINGPMTPVADGTLDNGNAFLRWGNVSSDVFEGAGGITISSQTTPSGFPSVASVSTSSLVDVALFTGSNADADAVKTQCVFIETGNKSNAGSSGTTGDIVLKTGDAAGSGDSGPVIIDTGTSASGTRGTINLKGESLATSTVNDVWVLQDTLTGAGSWETVPAAAANNVGTYSSTATVSSTDNVSILSGASFTLTLTTAVGNTGKIFEIVHNGTSLTQVYTIDGNGSQSIRGNLTFNLHTNGERLRIVSDGANWVVLDHYTATAWIDGGTASSLISAETTGPTAATTPLVDKVWWRRVGNSMEIRYEYKHTNNAGSAGGTGDYIFTLPGSQSLDTAVLEEVTGNTPFDLRSTIGHGIAIASASFAKIGAYPYDSTGFRLFGFDTTQYVEIGSGAANYPMDNAAAGYVVKVTAPIDGWEH